MDLEGSDTLDTLPQATKTPTPKAKRLSKALWGSKAASERKKACNRARQQRRRARLRAEQRWRDRDVSEDEDEEVPLPVDPAHPMDPGDIQADGHVWDNEEYGREEADIVNSRNVVTELAQTSCNAQSAFDRDIATVGEELARIKVTSNISDAAMDKLLKFFFLRRNTLVNLVEENNVHPSYSKGFRPAMVEQLIPIFCSILLKEQIAGEPHQYRKVEELKCIPNEYLNLREEDGTKLLRLDTYVHVKDAKQFFFDTHGGRNAATLQQTLHSAISVDGVAESKRGTRTFIVVSIRFGCCLYLLRIFNSLVGVDESKPSPMELLRYIAGQLQQFRFLKLSMHFQASGQRSK